MIEKLLSTRHDRVCTLNYSAPYIEYYYSMIGAQGVLLNIFLVL